MPNRSRCASMNSTSAAASGRVPSRNKRSRPSISHSPAGAHVPHAPAQRSAAYHQSSCRDAFHRQFPPAAARTAAPPGEHPAAGQPWRSPRAPSRPAPGSPAPSSPRARGAHLDTSSVPPWPCILPGIRASKVPGMIQSSTYIKLLATFATHVDRG